MSDHAILSPSSAERWIHCPPSAKINAEAPRRDTAYTTEGTQAHALAELKARKRFLGGVGPKTWAKEIAQIEELWGEIPAEMRIHTDTYLEALTEIYQAFRNPPHVAVEQKVDFGYYIPDAFGTCDCLMVGRLDETHEMLQIVDFKYGKGVPVSAERNPQMMLYALGALLSYGDFYDIGAVGMTIVQPRVKSEPDTWTISPRELYEWAETVVKPAAKLAMAGEGDFAEGEWCRFCAIKGSCRARAEANLQAAKLEFRDAPELSPEEIGEALTLGQRLKSWLTDIEDYALTACLDGREIPGYKAVAGRAVRAWTDQPAAFEAARAAGVPEEKLYERKPVTLAALEKVMGKKPFAAALGAYVTTPPGKPTLVPAADKRPPITGRPTANEDFKEE